MGTITIERPVYSDEVLRETFARDDVNQRTITDHLKQKWNKFSLKDQMKAWFPISVWLLQYNVKKQLLGDTLAGITIALVNIPQGMAFAALTLLPPVFGLYIAFFPVIFYILMGSCPHQSWGGFGVTAIMSGDAVSRIIDSQITDPLYATGSPDATTGLTPVDQERAYLIIEVSITIALLVGIMQTIMGLLRMGFVAVYLSKSFIQALTAGAACHVVTTQVSVALGISVERFSGPFAIVLTWIEIFKNFPNINWATVVVSAISLTLLLAMNFVNERYKDKLPVPIPMDVIVVVVLTILSYFLEINMKYDVAIVDEIPLGFPKPRVPSPNLFGTLLADSFAIALVTYAVDISLGKTIAVKYDYQIDDNQELVASGVCNTFSSFFLCYVSGPSLARIWIVERAGGTSQITSVFNCIIVLLIMLFLGNLLEPLPLAVLGVLLIFSLVGMIAQVKFLPSVYRQSKWDFGMWLFTFLVVVFLGVALGLFLALGVACIIVAVRHQLASFGEEVNIDGSEIFVDKKAYKVENSSAACEVFYMDRSLCFLNAVKFKKELMRLVSSTETCQDEIKDTYGAIEMSENNEKHAPNGSTAEVTSHCTNDDESEDDMNNAGTRKIIINCSSFNFVDLDGARMLSSIIMECHDMGITVLLACCKESVRSMLLGSGQFEGLTRVFYPTVIDAYSARISDVKETS